MLRKHKRGQTASIDIQLLRRDFNFNIEVSRVNKGKDT